MLYKKFMTNIDNTYLLTVEQDAIFCLLETSVAHMFITGKAGTGKSYLLTYVQEHTAKNLVVLAPTGVAALTVGGQTIHSFFGLPPALLTPEVLAEHDVAPHKKRLLRSVDVIVIDEVSMVRADMMDAMDMILRRVRKVDAPFGGVQMVLFGDLYQLPPVVSDATLRTYFSDYYAGPYFFNARVWQQAVLEMYELQDVFRQEDDLFKDILNRVREGRDGQAVCAAINERVVEDFPDDGVVVLTMTNAIAQRINAMHLRAIDADAMVHTAIVDGAVEQSAFPTEEQLRLKVGAQVMFLKNDPEHRWVNGTMGYVEDMDDEEILVRAGDDVHIVARAVWHRIRYVYNRDTKKIEEEVVSSFTQFPLRLAWAITVHKSQGQTYDAVIIDRGRGAFAHGQMYVALSRCRHLETVYLTAPICVQDLIVDHAVTAFMHAARG